MFINLLINDKRIKAVSFVGSTQLQKKVYKLSTASGKRCQALGEQKVCFSFIRCKYRFSGYSAIWLLFGSSGTTLYGLIYCFGVSCNLKSFIESLIEKVSKLKIGFENLVTLTVLGHLYQKIM